MNTTSEIPVSGIVLIRLLLTIVIIFILITAKSLLIPLFFAVLFAYALYPSAQRLENAGIPRIITNLTLIIIFTGIAITVIYALAQLIGTFTDDLSTVRDNLDKNITWIKDSVKEWVNVSDEQFESMADWIQNPGQILGYVFTSTSNTILAIGLIPVYTFLMLLYRNKFRDFVSKLTPEDKTTITQYIIDQTADVVPRYLKGLVIVCIVLIIINTAGFYIIGIEFAFLMGIISAFFNLIPYLGTVIGYGLVCLFVFLTQSPALALAVAGQFFIVQFLENNILTPNITGSYVQINPLVMIVSLIAGGMIWGLPGMFLVIPYLAFIKIVCENIPGLNPLLFYWVHGVLKNIQSQFNLSRNDLDGAIKSIFYTQHWQKQKKSRKMIFTGFFSCEPKLIL